MSAWTGSRCLSRAEGHWTAATIRGAFADGTFKVEQDAKSVIVLPHWYGVTRAELDFRDESEWDAMVGTRLDPDGGPLRDQYCPIYWNQTRMGGRDPSEVARPITVDDAKAAIGLDGTEATAATPTGALAVPASIRALLSGPNAAERVTEVHPNNPHLVWPAKLHVERDLREQLDARDNAIDGTVGLVLLAHYEIQWLAVFDEGEADARIYVRWDTCEGTEPTWSWRPCSPSVAFFFWDLAQTGLAWWQDTKHQGGKPVVATDVGLALDLGPRAS